MFANLAVNVGINRWNKWFFDALERKDGSTLWTAVIVIVVLVALGAAFAVAMVWCRMTLQVKWRQWLTGEMLARWLSEQRYYRLAVTDEDQINPEYRIADDLRLAWIVVAGVCRWLHQRPAGRRHVRRHPVLGWRIADDRHRRH